MENDYKAFMDKQHPSEALIADTISKARELSAEESTEEISNRRDSRSRSSLAFAGKWVAAALLAFCLMIAVQSQSTDLQYAELDGRGVSQENGLEIQTDFESERNSYLGAEEPDYYVFDGEAQVSEIKVSQGIIKVQTGMVERAGRQSLYRTVPESMRGQEVYTGKSITDDRVVLYAAFELEGTHYYLEGRNVTEREMTEYIRKLLKNVP